MNTRTREICRAMLMREKPDYMATLRNDDGKPFAQILFIPQDQVEEYKAKYGDRLEIWWHEDV